MKTKLAHYISREELEEIVGGEVADPVETGEATDVVDLAIAQEAEDEMNDTIAETAETAEVIEEVGESQDAAEEVVEEQAERLESETPITPEEAAVATESLRNVIRANGLENSRRFKDYGAAKGSRLGASISQESLKVISSNPKMSYQIAHEGFKEVAIAMKNTLVELYKKLVAQIKKLTTNIVAWVSSFSKEAEGLATKASKLTIASDVAWTEDEAKKWKEQLGVLAFINGGKIDSGLSKVTEYLDCLSDTKTPGRVATSAIAVFHNPSSVDYKDIVLKQGNTLAISLDSLVAKNTSKFDGGQDIKDAAVVGFTGSSIKLMEFKEEGPSMVTVKLSEDAISKHVVEFPTASGLKAALTSVAVTTKSAKAFADSVNKFSNEITTAVSSAANASAEDDKDKLKAIKVADKLARSFAGSVALDSIQNLLRANKTITAYCATAIKKAEGKKEEKAA